MRLSEAQIRQGILHPERDVRSNAVLYFSRSFTEDESILPLAIQAIQQHGWDEAFDAPMCVTQLPLTDETLSWVLGQLQHEDGKRLDEFDRSEREHTLDSLLSNAAADLLARHKQAILSVPDFDSRVRKIVIERTDLVSADPEDWWRELERFSVEAKDVQYIGDVDLDHAYALVEAIAREKEKHRGRVLAILGEKIEVLEGNPQVWMETFAIRLAGLMRLEPAIPLIVGKLKEAGDEGGMAQRRGGRGADQDRHRHSRRGPGRTVSPRRLALAHGSLWPIAAHPP